MEKKRSVFKIIFKIIVVAVTLVILLQIFLVFIGALFLHVKLQRPLPSKCDHWYSRLHKAEDGDCTHYVHDAYYRCLKCRDYFNENKEIFMQSELFYGVRHNLKEPEILEKATCAKDGLMRYYCGDCNFMEYEDR